jgi:hypothetical protein
MPRFRRAPHARTRLGAPVVEDTGWRLVIYHHDGEGK